MEEKNNDLEDKVDDLEIRINCLEGKHTWNNGVCEHNIGENIVTYSWTDDYSECGATVTCIYCEEIAEKVESSEESTGHYIATFKNDLFVTQHIVLNETALTSITSRTITLVSDIDLVNQWVVAEGVDIVLDLNGKAINYNSNGYAIYVNNGGKITIEDSVGDGFITSSDEFGSNIENYGTLVINGGNIVSEQMYAITNRSSGTTTINGGNISGYCAVNNSSDHTAGEIDGILEINGGTISSTSNTCIIGTVTINGSPTLTTEFLHFSLAYEIDSLKCIIDLTNYTGAETFSIYMSNAYTNQFTLPERWSLYEDEEGTIPTDGSKRYFEEIVYAIKNESLN